MINNDILAYEGLGYIPPKEVLRRYRPTNLPPIGEIYIERSDGNSRQLMNLFALIGRYRNYSDNCLVEGPHLPHILDPRRDDGELCFGKKTGRYTHDITIHKTYYPASWVGGWNIICWEELIIFQISDRLLKAIGGTGKGIWPPVKTS